MTAEDSDGREYERGEVLETDEELFDWIVNHLVEFDTGDTAFTLTVRKVPDEV